MQFKKSLLSFGVTFLLTSLITGLIYANFVSASVYVRPSASDTIAGLGTQLEASGLEPYSAVFFEVQNPSGQTGNISTFADRNGLALVKLASLDTQIAGTYRVSLKQGPNALPGPSSLFEVLPGELSLHDSQLELDKYVASPDFKDEILFSVHLMDKYGNPIAYHQVQPMSDRSGDVFVLKSESTFTDEDGIVSYGFRSKSSGSANVSIYDVTAQSFLFEPVSVTFSDLLKNSAIGGHLSGTKTGSSIFGNSSSFETLEENVQLVFPNFPSQVKAGEPFSFTLEVQDGDGFLLGDFEGKVHFTVPGAQVGDVVLPQEYEFTFDDQGSHTFPLGMQFQREGTFTLIVESVDDPNVFTEQSVIVGSGQNASLFQGSNFSDITITRPTAGSYNNPSQVIEGKSSPGLTIKIYDNDREIASVSTDIKGNFTYTTSALTEGEHVLYAVSISSEGQIVGVSEDVTVDIDTSAPIVNEVTLDPPSGANPNQFVKISTEINEKLTQVVVQFQGNSIELKESATKQGLYEGVLQAPINFGTYPIDMIIIDELGNQNVNENVAFVVVGSGEAPDGFVAKIDQVEAHPSANRVTLLWTKPQSDQPIKHYRVYYGTSEAVLYNIVDTYSDDTSWYIPGLANGTTYYFAVTAVDTQGNESVQKSQVVSGLPFSTQTNPPVEQPPVLGDPVDPNLVTEGPNVQGDTGPELLGLLLFSIFGGNFLIRRRS